MSNSRIKTCLTFLGMSFVMLLFAGCSSGSRSGDYGAGGPPSALTTQPDAGQQVSSSSASARAANTPHPASGAGRLDARQIATHLGCTVVSTRGPDINLGPKPLSTAQCDGGGYGRLEIDVYAAADGVASTVAIVKSFVRAGDEIGLVQGPTWTVATSLNVDSHGMVSKAQQKQSVRAARLVHAKVGGKLTILHG
ncbi:hypothetical protein [uncultured Jatrophihabitans sp.]|uniref:hypothetical protein n=1 Tax=uncultured Jatrophihabitans sp. TaxID=1610747 RepID=UPI0035CB0E65